MDRYHGEWIDRVEIAASQFRRRYTTPFLFPNTQPEQSSAMNAPQRDAQPLSKVILLLIDPQLDFHDTLDGSVRKLPNAVNEKWMTELSPATNGSLAVNGSAVDSVAISNMIMKHMKEIDEIYVTLDTHHVNHIGHAAFWWKGEVDKKIEPTPFEDKIRHADIVSKKYQPKDQSLMDHVLHYSQQLENKGNFTEMNIWPEHCLIGTSGHAVVENVNHALQSWSEYHMKVSRLSRVVIRVIRVNGVVTMSTTPCVVERVPHEGERSDHNDRRGRSDCSNWSEQSNQYHRIGWSGWGDRNERSGQCGQSD